MLTRREGSTVKRGKTEFECIMSMPNLGKHMGKWIAVVDEDVIVGDAGKEVFKKSKQKHPGKEPLIMKVPSNTVMLL